MFASVLNTPPKKIWSVNLASESRKFFYPTIFMLPLLSFIYIHLIQGNDLVSQCIQFFPEMHAFFISNAFFSAQPHCSLTFSWIELQMLLKLCLCTNIILPRYVIFFVRQLLGLSMPYSYDLFFIIIFIVFNQIVSLKQTQLIF